MIEELQENPDISVKLILLNSKFTSDIITYKINKIEKYYVPYDISLIDSLDNDLKLLTFLKVQLRNSENTIFHFNWINHAKFSYLLKKEIDCATILTNHCIPWRDNIIDNYSLFKEFDEILLNKTNANIVLQRTNEYIPYLCVDHIICVTLFAKKTLRKLFKIDDTKLSVIYNGIDLPPVNNSKEELREKFGYSINDQILLFVGRKNEKKGIYEVLRIYDQISKVNRNLKLVIIGEGYLHEEELLEKNKNIQILEKAKSAVIHEFYKMADIGIIPSYIEQCSYVAIEMMHSGIPIIAADVDGLAELITTERGINFPLIKGKNKPYFRTGQICSKIIDLLKNPPLQIQLKNKAQEYALQNLNRKQMVDKTTDLYESLINQNKHEISRRALVSIILPCYNAEEYVKGCILSILKQSYQNFELIIIDDGSKDKTRNIIEEFNDSRIKIITNSENLGITKSLNKGISIAKGAYIARIDSDDEMHVLRLEKQVMYLENNLDTVLIGTNQFVINQNGQITGTIEYPTDAKLLRALMIFQNPISHPSVLMRTQILKKEKYLNRFEFAEDYCLWSRISKKYDIENLPEYLTYYRIHQNNTSKKNYIVQRENTALIMLKQLKQIGITPSQDELLIHIKICLKLYNILDIKKEEQMLIIDWLQRIQNALEISLKIDKATFESVKEYLFKECKACKN
ncbi:glycosyltransferase [Sphingobacterium sp. UDSM-2020]|nr:glycosyltransferase [Sphingobacterium sp. UDSM-2020]QQD11925.1 glycosyltransferase [Sphingobacterium sp. UDSM-2020]